MCEKATMFGEHMCKGLHRVRNPPKWSRDKESLMGGVNGGLREECHLKQLTHSSDWSGWLSGRLLQNQPSVLRPHHAWLLQVITGCSATPRAPYPNNSYFYNVHRFYFQLKYWKHKNTKAWNTFLQFCMTKDNYVRTVQCKNAWRKTSC